MKAGLTLEELAIEVDRMRDAKRDFVAPASRITMELESVEDVTPADADDGEQEVIVRARPEPKIVLADGNGGKRFGMNPSAHKQLAGRLGIPVRYYNRMREERPELLARNVNDWLADDPRRFLTRTLDSNVRAFLSDSYRPLDNEDLLEAILPVLLHELGENAKGGIDLRFESMNVTPHNMLIKVVTPRIQAEIRKGDIVQAGALIRNSEVGEGSLELAPFLYRCWCSNGAISQDFSMRKTHIGRKAKFGDLDLAQEWFTDETRAADDRALWLKVRDSVRGFFNPKNFEKIVDKHREAATQPLNEDKVEDVVEVTAKHFGLNDGEKRGVLRHLLQGDDAPKPKRLTRYELVQAVTATSQDLDSYDRATDLERIGGRILELNKAEWGRLALVN